MQRLSLDISQAAAVHIIAGKRMTDTAHMTADLMSPARLEPQIAKRVRVTAFYRLIMRDGRTAVGAYTALDLTALLQSYRQVYGTALADDTFAYSRIYLLNGGLYQ